MMAIAVSQGRRAGTGRPTMPGALIRLLGLGAIVLFSCRPAPSRAGAACISVDDGPAAGGRSVAARPATYLLSFSGPAPVKDLAMSGDAVWVTLPTGVWTVRARAVDPTGRTIASGSVSSVEIDSGKTSPVSIALD